MRRLLLVLPVLVSLTACGGSADAPAVAPAPASSTTAASSIPSPSVEQANQLLADLSQVDLGLAVDRDRAVRRARDICLDVRAGKTDAELAAGAVTRYAGGEVPTLTAEQGAAIVTAVRGSFCP